MRADRYGNPDTTTARKTDSNANGRLGRGLRERLGSAAARNPVEGAMKFLSDEQLQRLLPAETSSYPSPVPTQIVSSDEYLPVPQTERQREVEARLREMSERLAKRQGLSRRRFFQTASGMAASFVAMNQV